MIGEGGEAVQLCLTEGERSEPSAVPTTAQGPRRGPTLAGVRPLRGRLYGWLCTAGSPCSPAVKHSWTAPPPLSILFLMKEP